LAFGSFEGYVRVAPEHLLSAGEDEGAYRHIRGAIRATDPVEKSPTADAVRPIIHIASVVNAITRRLVPEGAPKES
jgi:hypothetical protein